MRPVSRKELIKAADRITEQLEEANLQEKFSPALAETVNNFEWLVHFEGHPVEPAAPPENGAEAHARLMDSLSFVLAGEILSS
jgi:hypothetical protein